MGRWNKKDCVEDCRVLSVQDVFYKRDANEAERIRAMYWNEKGYMELTITQTNLFTGETKKKGIKITLSFSDCNYGNYRIWFKCPNCRRQVGNLYSNYKYGPNLYCRHCMRLTYKDRQYKGGLYFEIGRLRKKIHKIEEKLKRKLRWETIGVLWDERERLTQLLRKAAISTNLKFENWVNKTFSRTSTKM